MATKKRASFANPAVMAFISPQEPAREEPQRKRDVAPSPAGTNNPPIKEVLVYMKPETKSKRFNALLKLSNYEQAKSKAGDLGISINEYINRLIEQDA